MNNPIVKAIADSNNDAAKQAANTMLRRFEGFYRCFLEVTAGAQQRFEQANWLAVQLAARERIRLYDHHVADARIEIKRLTGHLERSDSFCAQVKHAYSDLLQGHENFELAESFFNSVYQRLFHHRYIREDLLFIRPHRANHLLDVQVLLKKFEGFNLEALFRQLLKSYHFNLPFEDIERDAQFLAQALLHQLPQKIHLVRLHFLKTVFYRNKGAYLIGEIHYAQQRLPLAIPLLHSGMAIYADALLSTRDQLSIIFGFARAYFMVDVPSPRRLVNYLKQLMPHKRDYELFTAIGCQKHGKTEFYRDYLLHLSQSQECFELAAGIKGMVMCVFTLPSFDVVFKVIKDAFTPPKNISRAQVRAKYQMVKQHDRVGRMADTLEFTNFEFPRARISRPLLDELLRIAPSQVSLSDSHITIKHLYTERKMIPLNLYLDSANEADACHIIDEYANAIKQLAGANIFPGDMLFKNFGVTRHKRVIFYDYDEICYMSECHFRAIPAPRYPEDEFAAEPWYSVGPNDVFPEEFATFLLIRPLVKAHLLQYHRELFTPQFWQKQQFIIAKGGFQNVFPYSKALRFMPR